MLRIIWVSCTKMGAWMYYKKIEWYEKAAEHGVHVSSGHGVDQSDSMAMRWYAKAAAHCLFPSSKMRVEGFSLFPHRHRSTHRQFALMKATPGPGLFVK